MTDRTSLVRTSRLRQGVGVRELARRCAVAPATVTDWEASEVRGSIQIATLERALAALDETVSVRAEANRGGQQSLERREQRISLEIHRAIARKLIDNPDGVLSLVPSNVERRREQVRGGLAFSWLDEWLDLALRRDIGALVNVLLGASQRDVDMRQVSPFTGALSQSERAAAIERASR